MLPYRPILHVSRSLRRPQTFNFGGNWKFRAVRPWRVAPPTLVCDLASNRQEESGRSDWQPQFFGFGTLFGGFGMNRMFVFGVAMFFAIVGFALMGGERQAVAGHGCGGCHGVVTSDCGTPCCEPAPCGGRARHQGIRRAGRCGGHASHRRLLSRRGCGGQPADCCGTVVTDCCGVATEGVPQEAVPQEATPDTPPTPEPGGEAPVEEGSAA